ncbi:MAG: hypothetical protein C5B57_08170, partial [Blastocatellia bacterium]
TTALFSLVDAALIRPLPYPDSDRLVMLWERPPKASRTRVSPLDLIDWSEQSHSFASMAGVLGISPTALNDADGTSETVVAQIVTTSFFDVLGIQPLSGRMFVADDAKAAAAGVVVSENLWRRRFGADPNFVGRAITLGERPVTVLGIAPGWFQFMARVDAWALYLPARTPDQRQPRFLQVIARLKSDVSLAQAEADMAVVADNIARQSPGTNAGWGVTIDPLKRAIVSPELRTTAFVLGGAVLFVLLLACANVANLLLSRGVTRTREMAVRAALGGSRGRILRQILTESLLLSILGGALGLAFSWAVLRIVPSVIPPQSIPETIVLAFDQRLTLFAIALTFATSLLFGAAPAWNASRVSLTEAMNAGGRGTTHGAGRFRAALTVCEVAAAVLLVTGAGLFLRTLMSLDGVDPGYRAQNVVTMSIGLPVRYQPDRIRAVHESIQRDVAVIPGVRVVSIAGDVPLAGFSMGQLFEVLGQDNPPSPQRAVAHYQMVGPNYFEALGIPLLRGRAFTDNDTATANPVCIINEEFAKRYFSVRDPIGARINVATVAQRPQPIVREVVGVIRQVKVRPDEQQDQIEIYVPASQNPWMAATLAVQADARPAALVPAITAAITRIDKAIAVTRVRTMEDVAAESTARPRFRAQLIGSFAAIAVVLAGVGVFSVLMFNVHQRRREFSIRIALGARSRDLVLLVLANGVRLIAIGLTIGVAASGLLVQSLTTLLHGVRPLDPITFVAAAGLLAAIAVAACAGPALSAARSDAAVSLRQE